MEQDRRIELKLKKTRGFQHYLCHKGKKAGVEDVKNCHEENFVENQGLEWRSASLVGRLARNEETET